MSNFTNVPELCDNDLESVVGGKRPSGPNPTPSPSPRSGGTLGSGRTYKNLQDAINQSRAPHRSRGIIRA